MVFNDKILFTVPVSCGSAGECESESLCRDSMCLTHCKADDDCALNERCTKGSCMCK